MAAKSAKSSRKKTANITTKAGVQNLRKEVVEWLKKEGMQAREAVETLIQSKKKKAVKNGEDKLAALAKSIVQKKAELKKLTVQLKKVARKK